MRQDGPTGAAAAIVNERFAAIHWPGADPLGRRLRLFDGDAAGAWLTVVGVASNVVQDVTRQATAAIVYLPYRQHPAPDMWLVVRTAEPTVRLGTTLQRELAGIDRDLPIWIGPFSLEQRLAGMGNYWTTGGDAALLLAFAALALLLASGGLYAVVSHSVSQRVREIGVRVAVGASPRDVLELICRQGMRPVAVGLLIGLSASVGVNRLLESRLVEVSAFDPVTVAAASGVLVACAALGCVIPALRATRVDPAVVLRS
jgi:putative ABC transport system permease protein